MKAIQVHEFGGPEVLRYEDVDEPTPGADEVLIKVKAAGVNFIDIYQRTGAYPLPLPSILGREAAGIVEAVGDDVTEFKPGDRVAYAMALGAYAEVVTVPAKLLVPMPDNLDFVSAAAVMLQGMTAHYLVHSTYPLGSDKSALIHAAAGGTGRLIVQMAKKLGATVIGTVSTEEKAKIARTAGADHVIRYTEVDFAEETRRLTDGRGVSVVYDSVGKTTFAGSLSVLQSRGCLALFGQASGKVPDFDLARLGSGGSLYVTRPSLFHYITTREELLWRAGDLFKWLAAGELSLRVDRQLPLAAAAEAHTLLAGRKTSGKLVLMP